MHLQKKGSKIAESFVSRRLCKSHIMFKRTTTWNLSYPHSSKYPEQQHIDGCPGKDAQEGVVLPLETECDDEHCDGRGNACSDDIGLYTLEAIDNQHRHASDHRKTAEKEGLEAKR